MSRARLPGFGIALLGVAVGLEATTFNVSFMTDPVGPKALPLLVAVMLFGAGAHAAWSPARPAVWPPAVVVRRLIVAVGWLIAYALTLGAIGFFLSTTIVVAGLSRLFGARVRPALIAAAALSGALWLLFVRLLGLPLPIGLLWMR